MSATRRTFVTLVVVALSAAYGAGCTDDSRDTNTEDGPQGPEAGPAAWPMHPIDDRYRGANALGVGDVNGDGFDDYVTNYEFDQRYVLQIHPGEGADPRGPWTLVQPYPADDIPQQGINAESAALGDVDGDGNVDLIGAQGFSNAERIEGSEPGIRVVFGPATDQIADRSAWVDGGTIPATLDQGHFHWVSTPVDLNDDGLVDVVGGGRVHGSNRTTGGIFWLEAPPDPSARRDMSKWQMHRIDARTPSGHGFAWSDVDEDGDLDIIDANSDFDTADEEKAVYWYRNPGPDGAELRSEWERTELYRGEEFTVKPSVTVADLDADGDEDFLTQVDDAIYWFRKDSTDPVTFERVVIDKPDEATQFSRPIRVADMDGDGNLDIVGFLVHEDADLPADKYGGFLARYSGDAPTADNWTFTPIRWGSGEAMRFFNFGEKWDQVWVVDVDRDGDLDLVANNEEWWVNPEGEFAPFNTPAALETSSVATVWFENRLDEPAYRFTAADGVVGIEAEQATEVRDSYWIIRNRYAGFTGTGYLQAHHSLDVDEQAPEDTQGFGYRVDADGGDYTVWIRRYTPANWGTRLGGEQSDSAWVGVEGASFVAIGDGGATDTWEWVKADEVLTLPNGTSTIDLRVRDRGVAIDQVVLARDPSFEPT